MCRFVYSGVIDNVRRKTYSIYPGYLSELLETDRELRVLINNAHWSESQRLLCILTHYFKYYQIVVHFYLLFLILSGSGTLLELNVLLACEV
jgi:hypothetical protein